MTLGHLFLIHRYKGNSVHFVTPSEDNQRQTEGMKARGIFTNVREEVGEIIVADVNAAGIERLLALDRVALRALIAG
jgi:isocitrate lyase